MLSGWLALAVATAKFDWFYLDDELLLSPQPAADPVAKRDDGEAARTVDVILCDVMMPSMSGPELHRQLTAASPEHAERTIFLTGGAFSADVREFLDSVSNLRVEKPFDPMALRALINDRLEA